jgi:hypothetical protein
MTVWMNPGASVYNADSDAGDASNIAKLAAEDASLVAFDRGETRIGVP